MTPRRLSTFTVAELDALPVGARFIDLNDPAVEREANTFTKGANYVWTAPVLLDSTSEQLIAEMASVSRYDYVLEIPHGVGQWPNAAAFRAWADHICRLAMQTPDAPVPHSYVVNPPSEVTG